MSKKLVTSYTFVAASKTVQAADFTNLEKIQLITNVTSNIIIYNFADPNKGGSLAGTTLTLDYDTTSMADANKLQIFVEDGLLVDAVAGATDAGIPTLAVRDDTLTTLTPADGDYTRLRTDQYGALWTSMATKLNSTDDSVSAVVTDVTPGTAAASLGKAEDAAHASGDTGVMALAVRRDTRAASSGTTGDYEPLSTDSVGALWVTGGQVEDAVHGTGNSGMFMLGVGNVAQTTLAADGDYIGVALDTKGNVMVGGNVAAAATDAGNPVKVGAKYNSTLPTYTDGQRGDLQIGTRGSMNVTLFSADTAVGAAYVVSNADGSAVGSGASRLEVVNRNTVYNGATINTFDRVRGNEEVTLLASAARTTTQTSADITNYNGNTHLIVVLDMTVVGTGSVTLSVEGKDTVSGKYYVLLTGAAVVTNVTNRYKVTPALAAVANVTAQDILPRIFRIVVTANNANSATYSVGYNLIRD